MRDGELDGSRDREGDVQSDQSRPMVMWRLTGRVILYLLDRSKREDQHLRSFAHKLMAHDPRRRPSLLEWASSSDAAFLRRGRRSEIRQEKGFATSARHKGSWRRKHEAPGDEEAKTRQVAPARE